MKFGFIAKHRNIWPVAWLCEAMGVSRSGFHAWLNRSPSARSRSDETVGQQIKASFLASDRTYGARRIWRDLLADGVDCGLHRIERLMRLQALRARPRRRRLPEDEGDRQVAHVPANLLDRQFVAERPNQKWIDLYADRTSAATMRAKQLRLWFAAMAYVLICALRRIGLADTAFADATCGTIRLKLLKIGALVRISVRRIKIAMASACPAAQEWGHVARRLAEAAKGSRLAGLRREAATRPNRGITNRPNRDTQTKSPAAPSAPRLLVALPILLSSVAEQLAV